MSWHFACLYWFNACIFTNADDGTFVQYVGFEKVKFIAKVIFLGRE